MVGEVAEHAVYAQFKKSAVLCPGVALVVGDQAARLAAEGIGVYKKPLFVCISHHAGGRQEGAVTLVNGAVLVGIYGFFVGIKIQA